MTDPPPGSRHPLLALEDWWAVWLGALLIAGVVTDLVTGVPGVGRWTASLGDAFGAARVGGLTALGGGLLLLTTLAVWMMGGAGARHSKSNSSSSPLSAKLKVVSSATMT